MTHRVLNRQFLSHNGRQVEAVKVSHEGEVSTEIYIHDGDVYMFVGYARQVALVDPALVSAARAALGREASVATYGELELDGPTAETVLPFCDATERFAALELN